MKGSGPLYIKPQSITEINQKVQEKGFVENILFYILFQNCREDII